MRRQQVIVNALMAVAQVLVTGGGLFLLYRYLLATIGVEQLGIWSLVLATTSAAGAANPGLSASAVKFVAQFLARDEEQRASEAVQTLVIAMGAIAGVVLLVAWPGLRWLLSLLLAEDARIQALLILPYSLASLWLTLIAGVLQSALDGCHRASQRSLLAIVGMLVFLFLSWQLVRVTGLLGLAVAQICQAGVLLIGSWLLLRRNLSVLPLLPRCWSRELFREMLSYSLSFQVISISQMLYEPATKALLTAFGGLTITGFYEMAGRMVLQLRSLLVSAGQVLVPALADLHERKPEEVSVVYRDFYRLMFCLAVPFFAAIIAFTPIISWLWIGHYERIFVWCATSLAAGWLLNTLAAPAYFANLGTGDLRWNTISHVIMAVLNIAIGVLLGWLYGAGGVVIAWLLALATGAVIIVIAYHRAQRLPLRGLLPKVEGRIGSASLLALIFSLLIRNQLHEKLSVGAMAALIMAVFAVVLAVPLWQHPFRRRSQAWLTEQTR